MFEGMRGLKNPYIKECTFKRSALDTLGFNVKSGIVISDRGPVAKCFSKERLGVWLILTLMSLPNIV